MLWSLCKEPIPGLFEYGVDRICLSCWGKQYDRIFKNTHFVEEGELCLGQGVGFFQ